MVTPSVSVQTDGAPLHSYSNYFCAQEGKELSLLCNSTIEQGNDVRIEWFKEVREIVTRLHLHKCHPHYVLVKNLFCSVIYFLIF